MLEVLLGSMIWAEPFSVGQKRSSPASKPPFAAVNAGTIEVDHAYFSEQQATLLGSSTLTVCHVMESGTG